MIQCHNVSKKYRSTTALADVTVSVPEHAIVGLVGRNGAGKTTLLKIIAGYLRPTSGEVSVFEQQPFDNLFVAANSILIDDSMVFPEVLALGEILDSCQRFYPNWDDLIARRLMTYFEFNENTYYYELSKGKKSTFKIIIGIATRAPLTLFDEPTSGMDRSVRQDFYRALLKDYLQHPRTIIISSHHIEEIEHLLAQLILIDNGKVRLHLPMDDIRDYAIGIKGEHEKVREWLKGKDVLYEEEIGIDDYYAVVTKENHLPSAEANGFAISAIPAADLAVYLTKKTKGVIDDVYRTAD